MSLYSKILAMIPGLSQEEREKLPTALAALSSFGGKAPSQTKPARVSDDERWLLDIVVEAAAEAAGEFTSVSQLQRSSYIAEFRRNIPFTMRYLSRSGLTRVEQRALYKIGVKFWIRYRIDIARPANARTFLQQGNIAAIINMAFPGYAAHGLLKLIVRRNMESSDVRKKQD